MCIMNSLFNTSNYSSCGIKIPSDSLCVWWFLTWNGPSVRNEAGLYSIVVLVIGASDYNLQLVKAVRNQYRALSLMHVDVPSLLSNGLNSCFSYPFFPQVSFILVFICFKIGDHMIRIHQVLMCYSSFVCFDVSNSLLLVHPEWIS